MTFTWQPLLPLWITLPVAAAVVVLVIGHARRCSHLSLLRRGAFASLRLLAVAAVLIALLGPTRLVPIANTHTDRSQLVVLLDASASMDTADVGGQRRLDVATQRWLSDAQLAAMARTHDVSMIAFGQTSMAIDPTRPYDAADSIHRRATNLQDALDAAHTLLGDRIVDGSILLLSDGHDTSGNTVNAPPDVPIFAVPLGTTHAPSDLDIGIATMQTHLYVNETGRVRISIQQRGSTARTAMLTVRADGQHTQHVVTFHGNTATIDLPVQFANTGSHEVTASVAALADESITANNTARTFVDVTDARPEVLIIEADPSWDSRFMAESLTRDERLAVTQVTQIGPTRQQITRTRSRLDLAQLPGDVAGWSAFDLVILGGKVERALSPDAARALATAVRQQGTCLLLTRTTSAPAALEALSPLAAQPTERRDVTWPTATDNAISQATLRDTNLAMWPTTLPALRAATGSPTPAAIVLVASVQGTPLVGVRPIGAGRVMAVNAAGLWRWALHAPDGSHGDRLLDALWMQLAHRAIGAEAAGADWSLQATPARQRVDEPAFVRLRSRVQPLNPQAITVTQTSPNGQTSALTLPAEGMDRQEQRWRIDVQEPGVYTFDATWRKDDGPVTHRVRLAAYDDREERLDPRARPAVMERLAAASGGAVLQVDKPADLMEVLRSAVRDATQNESRAAPLWTDSAALMAVLLLLGIEWIMRKQLGLS